MTQELFRFADVILPINLPQTLTYGIPLEMQQEIRKGMRVEVALGRNKSYAGIVAALHNNKPEQYEVKPVKALLDKHPIVNDIQLAFWQWICQYYVASPGEVMQAALPAHLKLSGETRLEWIGSDKSQALEWSDEGFIVMEALQIKKVLTISEIKSLVGNKLIAGVINEMIANEVVIINEGLEELYTPKTERVVKLDDKFSDEPALVDLFQQLQKAPRQLELLMAYLELSKKHSFVKQTELIARASSSAAAVKALVDKGIFMIFEQHVDRITTEAGEQGQITFTDAQQAAYSLLSQTLMEKDVLLLKGVTGSGKTLLYIRKIRECIEQGRQAIFLLPEIALTTQLVSRLRAYFGTEMGVYHSRFSNNERVEIWEKVANGNYKIVVGTRSALWLPFDNLGLIVIDEEHDASYKQKDPAPRFHARDASVYLARLYGAKVILGSATPSVETQYNVQQEKYGFVELRERYQGVRMPDISIVDARSLEKVKASGIKLITPELESAIGIALQQHKQTILFQNRRGYSPFQMCTTCGWVPHCRNCAVSLTYHKSTDKLHCHYCGVRIPVLHQCMQCGSSSLVSKTFGTEKIEEEVRLLFPKARIARMDLDSTRGKQRFSQLLDELHRQKIDILVGTQMVVKGLDFANVALVGILSADSLLSYPDFRVNERAFQLMKQVSGRAGRADGKGNVLIQAYDVNHKVLRWIKEDADQALYDQEVEYRSMFGYPPFTRLIKVVFKHKDDAVAVSAGISMLESLGQLDGISVQGPVQGVVARIQNLFIRELWIKCSRDTHILSKVKGIIKNHRQLLSATRGLSSVQVIVDVDPV